MWDVRVFWGVWSYVWESVDASGSVVGVVLYWCSVMCIISVVSVVEARGTTASLRAHPEACFCITEQKVQSRRATYFNACIHAPIRNTLA